LPTTFPVYYFGTKHAKVYVVYAISWGGSYVLVAGILEEFSYNYEEESLFYRNRPVLIPKAMLDGNEKMKEIQTSGYDKDKLTEIVAKSFLNESIISTQPISKSTGSPNPESE
jgi:hypothetical protein